MLPRKNAARLRSRVHDFFERFGIDVVRLTSVRHSVGRRMRLIRALGIDLVFDVGANGGQYGAELRRHGYGGRIVSFEPLADPFRLLAKRAERDCDWAVRNVGLAAARSRGVIHVSENSVSSSILPMLATHEENAPESRYVRTEEIELRRLDDIAEEDIAKASATFLKLDVQGYEREVLTGAAGLMDRVTALQVELSLVPLYGGAPDPLDLLAYLKVARFSLVGVEPGFASPDGRLLQADGIFVTDRVEWGASQHG